MSDLLVDNDVDKLWITFFYQRLVMSIFCIKKAESKYRKVIHRFINRYVDK